MMKAATLQNPPEWINWRHEEIQQDRENKWVRDRRIAHAYATDYGEVPGMTIWDIVKEAVGAAVVWVGIALAILALQ